MNAFQFLDNVRRNGGDIEVADDGQVIVTAFPDELEVAVLNRDAIREALINPGRWPCRKFQSHPTTPTLPCRTCGESWASHPPDIRQRYDRPPLLAEAGAIVAAAAAEHATEARA